MVLYSKKTKKYKFVGYIYYVGFLCALLESFSKLLFSSLYTIKPMSFNVVVFGTHKILRNHLMVT